MKVAKVMQMMKRGKSVTFMQVEEVRGGETVRRGPQWVTDGGACYCLEGAPVIRNESEFFTAYDVKEKQQEGFYIKFNSLPNFIRRIERWAGSQEATAQRLTVIFDGVEALRGFQYGTESMLFIRARYLEPFEGEDNQYLEYIVRLDDNQTPFLCVYDGMDAKAAIMPFRFHEKNPVSDALYEEIAKFQYELFRQLNEGNPALAEDAAVSMTEQAE